MNIKKLLLFLALLLAACEGRAEEVCFYKISIDRDAYRAQEVGLGPYGNVAYDLALGKFATDIFAPSQSSGNATLFGAECNPEKIEDHIQEYYLESELEFQFMEITEQEYLKFLNRHSLDKEIE